jgi:2,5-diamino-6-(ribosylamino)-4(3H)-pyrimidinone 5'-phosphate reductase
MRIQKLVAADSDAADLYQHISWPPPPVGRPYVYINMVSTADGKIVLGDPKGNARGVGSPTDQALFRRLQINADAVMVGAVTLRASHVIYPPSLRRFTISRSGDIPANNLFFTGAPDMAGIFVPHGLPEAEVARLELSTGAQVFRCGETKVDLREALSILRSQFNVRTLLCEGGSALNFQMFESGLVDELFLTLAPKIKGGAHLPTIVGGQGTAPFTSIPLELVSLHEDSGELYLRYRVVRTDPAGGNP